jgi:peptidyl-tRNA hydrolase
MNESGVAVKKVMDFYQLTDPKKVIVVSDDINTLPGSLAIQGINKKKKSRFSRFIDAVVLLFFFV